MFRLKPASSIAFHSLFRSPWLYFSIFSVANTVLAYVESTNQTLLVTTSFCLFFFILLALFFLLKNGPSENPLRISVKAATRFGMNPATCFG
jgi:Ca2+/Na+ antiporter